MREGEPRSIGVADTEADWGDQRTDQRASIRQRSERRNREPLFCRIGASSGGVDRSDRDIHKLTGRRRKLVRSVTGTDSRKIDVA